MNLEEKKTVSQHQNDEIIRTGITTRMAAEAIGILPSYVSIAKNPASFDSMSKSAWDALEKWHLSREPLDTYNAPEKPKSTATGSRHDAEPTNGLLDPPDPDKPGKQLKPKQVPEKNGKSVKVILNQAEMAQIRKEIECLKRQIDAQKSLRIDHDPLPDVSSLAKELEVIKGWVGKLDDKVVALDGLADNVWVIRDEEIPSLQLQLKDLSAVVEKLQGEKKDSCVVVFQRNIYKGHEKDCH